MPTTVHVDQVGEIQFPDGMSEADIASTIKSNLPQWQSPPQGPKPTGFWETALGGETARGLGQSFKDVGGLAGAAARDVLQGNVFPNRGRFLPNLENVGAFLNRQPQPAEQTETGLQKAIAHGAEMAPDAIVTAVSGPAATIVFPAIQGLRAYSETGTPILAGQSAAIQAAVPPIWQKAGELTAAGLNALRFDAMNVMKQAFGKGFSDTVLNRYEQIKAAAQKAVGGKETVGDISGVAFHNPAEKMLASMEERFPGIAEGIDRQSKILGSDFLSKDRVMKAIETMGSSAGVTAYLEAVSAPQLLQMTTEQRNQAMLDTLVGGTLFSAILSVPEIIAGRSITGQTPEGEAYAARQRKNQEGDLSQYSRTDAQLQTVGQDRNVPSQELASSTSAVGSDSLRQSGQTPEVQAQAVAPILAPAAQTVFASNLPTVPAQIGIVPTETPTLPQPEVLAPKWYHWAGANTQAVLSSGKLKGGPAQVSQNAPFVKPPQPGQVDIVFSSDRATGTGKPVEWSNDLVSGLPPSQLVDPAIDILARNSAGNMVSVKDAYLGGASNAEQLKQIGATRLSQQLAPTLEVNLENPDIIAPALPIETDPVSVLRQQYEVMRLAILDRKPVNAEVADKAYLPGNPVEALKQFGYEREGDYYVYKEPTTAVPEPLATQLKVVEVPIGQAQPPPPQPLTDIQRKLMRREESDLKDFTDIALKNKRADRRQSDAIAVDDLLTGDVFKVDGEDFVVKELVFNPETQELEHIIAQDGKRFGVQRIAGKQLLYADKDSIVQHEPNTEFLDPQEHAQLEQMLGTPLKQVPAQPGPLPKLRPGEKQGDVFATQSEPLALVGETGKDFERIAREKEAAAKLKAEADAIAKANQRPLFAPTVPTSHVPTLVDSQGLIDRALAEGGGDSALKALVPNVRIRYGPLPAGVPGQYEGGVITISKPVMDFIATRFPAEAQGYINKIIAEELTHAVADTVLTPADYIAIAEALSAQDRQEMLAERPDVAAILNRTEHLRQLGGEYFAKLILSENEQSRPIDPNSTLGQRILTALQKIWDYLAAALRRLTGRSTVLEEAMRKVNQAKADILAGKTPEFSKGDPLNAKAIGQAMELWEQEQSARTKRAVEIAQVGEPIVAHKTAQETLATLKTQAGITKAQLASVTPEEARQLRTTRDIAAAVLRKPFIKNNLVTPAEHFQASINALEGDINTYESLKAKSDITPEELATAAGNVLETMQMFEASKTNLFYMLDKQRAKLTDKITTTFDAEVEALENRDLYSVLFKDFQQMGRLLMRIQKDEAVRRAYKQATGDKQATRNVLKFIHDNMDFSGMTYDDLRSVDDLWNRVRNTVIGMGKGGNVETVVGASEDAIRSVLRIVALSEPIRTELEQAKVVAATTQVRTPLTRLKTNLGEQIKAGNYDAALASYEKGIAGLGMGLKESRDLVNFYGANTRRLLINIKAIDETRSIAERLAAEPALIAAANSVYKLHNIATITHGQAKDEGVTSIAFKRADPADPPITIRFSNQTSDLAKTIEDAKILSGEYQAYIANPDAPGFDPQLAEGMAKDIDRLARYLDPAQLKPRLMRSFPVKAWDFFSGKLGHFAIIPKYITSGMTGHLAGNVDITRTALSTIGELSGIIRRRHDVELDRTLKAALVSHNNISVGQYGWRVFNPLAASRQNFNNAGVLKPGDAIGNGEIVTAQDMAYLRAWRNYEGALHTMIQSTGTRQFAPVKATFAGIMFDKDSKVRSVVSHGPDMTGRDFPSETSVWIETWFKNDITPAERIAFLNFWNDPLLIGYVLGSRNADWDFGYSFPEATRDLARELSHPASDPLANFEDLVSRIGERYNAQEGVEPLDMDAIAVSLLGDFNRNFAKLQPLVAQAKANPKSKLSVIGGNSSFNTPRSALVMPPGWYKYGGVTAGDRAGVARAAALPFQLAHVHSVEALRDSLASVVQGFSTDASKLGITTSDQRAASLKQRMAGEILYDLGEAQGILENVDHWLTQLNVIMANSANPYIKDSVHMTAMRGGAQLVITSIVSGPAAVTKNIGGGYQNLVMLDVLIRRQNVLLSMAARSAETISQGLKEFLAYLPLHSGNPITGNLRKLLEKHENQMFIGQVAKLFLGYANRQRESYNYATDAGVNYNINLWASTKARWAFSRTLGAPRQDNPAWFQATANQISLFGNTLAQFIGQSTVGFADVRLNTRMLAAALPIEKHYRDVAIRWGDKLEANGLFPDKSLGQGWWGNDLSAARIRDFFRQAGVGPIDGIMIDFYRRWMDDKALERAENLPAGTYSAKTKFFTDPQFNQLEQALTEDNNATYANRPPFFRQSEAHSKLAPLWGYPTWFIRKLLELTNGLSSRGFFKNLVGNMPMLIQIGIGLAMTATLFYGAAAFLKRFFENKVTGFPTVFDAQNPKQAAQAILAATADSIPFIGTVFNQITGAGYRTGFDINSQFLALNVAGDAMRTYKEITQTGDIGGPMQRFVGRYLFPLNVVGAHAPNLTGLREFTNAKNILVMGARGTGLETKLRRTGGSGSDANYSPSTPIINRALNAIGKGDTADFQSAYQELVEQKRAAGSFNPAASALTALRGRSPLTSVFGTKPTQQELDQVYSNLSPALAARARDTLARFDTVIASLPRTGRITTRTAGRSRLMASSGGAFRLRRLRVRLRMARLSPPRLRRLAA